MRVVICGGGVIGASIAYFLPSGACAPLSSSDVAWRAPHLENLEAFLRWTGVTELRWKHWPDEASVFIPASPKTFTLIGVTADLRRLAGCSLPGCLKRPVQGWIGSPRVWRSTSAWAPQARRRRSIRVDSRLPCCAPRKRGEPN